MPSSYVAPVVAGPATDSLSLVSVVNFFMRNVGVILAGGLVFAVLLAIPAARAPRTYTATTTFITEGEQPPGRLILGGISLPGTGKGPEFYAELMKSPAVLGPLVESKIEGEAGQPAQTLIERYAGGEKRPHVAREAAIAEVASKMSTKISINGIVTLRVKAEDPVLAARLAEGILFHIDEFNNNKRRSQASAERRFAEQRLIEVKAEVRAVEERFQRFLEQNRQTAMSPALTLERDRIADEVQYRRALYSSILQAYERAKMDEVRDSPRATVLASPIPPTSPDSRSVTRNAILGLFLGLMLAGFFTLAREYFAGIPSQRTPEANEFAELRAVSSERLRRPFNAVLTAVRKTRQSQNL